MRRTRAALQWLDEPELSRHPRYLAAERRGIARSVRVGALTVATVQLADLALFAGGAPTLLAVNVPTAVIALALAVVLGRSRRARRYPIAGVVVLGAIALAATLVPVALVPELGSHMAGYVPILVVASALFVPWPVRWHVPWLLAAVTATAIFDAVHGPAATAGHIHAGLGAITLAAALTSFGGHAVLQRERRRSFAQRMQLRAMNHATRQQRRELEALAAQLEAVARRDPLTGIGNRLRLDEDVAALRSGTDAHDPVAAVLLDIDNFKDYNDRHGHLAGDAVLREIARTIAINVRPHDRVYRFGGEEFLVLLLQTDEAGAVAAANRIREAVLELEITSVGNRPWPSLTVSAGVAELDLAGTDDDRWIREADERLYRSKAAGRNIVTGSGTAPVAPIGRRVKRPTAARRSRAGSAA